MNNGTFGETPQEEPQITTRVLYTLLDEYFTFKALCHQLNAEAQQLRAENFRLSQKLAEQEEHHATEAESIQAST